MEKTRSNPTPRRHPEQRGPKPAQEKFKPQADNSLEKVFAKIGKPVKSDLVPDPFQIEALAAVDRTDCLVSAPTGAGKTWIAEQAIQAVFQRGGRCWYASPLKALSNAKWIEFSELFGSENVGIVTGDLKENTDARIIVGTTEILRNQLYDAMQQGENLDCDLVILDEAHYLGDRERGVVWEEIMIYLPVRINLLLLSATIGNAEEIAGWLGAIRNKECVVIRENKRPVPLYPLFFHLRKGLLPYLEDRKLNPAVQDFTRGSARGRRWGGPEANIQQILQTLEEFRLTPAIFFVKSRAECDSALLRTHLPPRDENEIFTADLEGLLLRFPYLREHRQLPALISNRLAAHHGGQLPAWKLLVESMMKKGHLRAIFATSTVAAGVNYPARTIVLFNSDIFNGHAFSPLRATEFHQMTGRAGRRGLDHIGFMLAVAGRFMDNDHLKKLLFRKSDDIQSQIKSDFSMVLNLLLSQTPETIRDIFSRSLASFQLARKKKEQGKGTGMDLGADLWLDFQRHLSFLKEEGFVDDRDRLTENGIWASKLRLDQPLLIAECIRRQAFPRDDEALLAAMVALFVYDGDQEIAIDKNKRPRRLTQAYKRVAQGIEKMAGRLEGAGFSLNPHFYWTSYVIYQWAQGKNWDEIVEQAGITDGGLAMLVTRTADNLRQIASLRDTHPLMAEQAARARENLLREPVVFI
ncbi:MAG: DEAD/DEAH box helicase [Smithellaceae bacterium]|nr:DEAD/DEAH box helicase [Smithellaceae bacterium]